MNMKIGVIFTIYNCEEYLENCLQPWFDLKSEYDFVFTSPPYYFIQKYENNTEYNSKNEMDEKFYTPLFSKSYFNLQPGGYFIINV